MIRLHLLGAVRLIGAGGDELTAVLQQPKRLALLTYLAVQPARLHRRDSLLPLFWPEADDARARASLRRALHFLRRSLGDDALVTRGDEVGTSGTAVWCDVAAVRDALGAGRREEAVALYTGDLLEGFFVPTAPAFEQWLDAERASLRREVAGAAAAVATTADAARRAMALAPDDERVLQRLMHTLDRSGDRAAALHLYDSFARRMSAEFGLEPSPETLALVRAVRERRETHAPAAAADTPPPISPDLIAVLPFAIRGDPAMAYLREGMVDLLGAKLDGAGELRTVDAHAILTRVQALDVEQVDQHTARDTARAFGAGAYVLGSAVVDGGRLYVRATLHDVASEHEVRADAEGETEEGIFSIVDTIVRTILAGRSASVGGHLGRLATVTTGSLPALKAYLRAERAFRAGQFAGAIESLEPALDADPTFALAWYRLAAARSARGLFDEARTAAAVAWDERRRLAEHTRYLVEAQRASLDGALASAESLYTRVLQSRPEDVEAWFHLGQLLFAYHFYRGRSVTSARAMLERTVALDPKHVAAWAALARIAAIEGRSDALDSAVTTYLERSPDGDQALPLSALRAFVRQDVAACQAVLGELARAAPQTVVAAIADIALAGNETQAAAALERLGSAAPTAAARLEALLVGAHVAIAQGEPDTAAARLDAAATLAPAIALEHRAWLLALPGSRATRDDIVRMQQLLAADMTTPRDPVERPGASDILETLRPAARTYLEGMLAARLGDLEAATAAAERCAALPATAAIAAMPTNFAHGLRARVALAAGDAASALAALDGVELGPWVHHADRSPLFALAYERALRAAALAASGRADEAAGWAEGLAERSPYELPLRSERARAGFNAPR